MEVGYDQSSDVAKIFDEAGYSFIEIVKDLNGVERVVVAGL